MGIFHDQITGFVKETKERMNAVFQMSVLNMIHIMQTPVGAGGNMPVDTGFLRQSILGVPDTLPPAAPLTFRPTEEGVWVYDPGPIELAIASATYETGFTIIYTANYAVYQEYGSQGRAPRRFVGLAVQRWPQIVSRASRELEYRIKHG